MSQAKPQDHGVQDAFVTARQIQAGGNIDEAKQRYGEILARVPHHAETLTMLASIAYQQGEDLQAQAYLDRAVAIYDAVLKQMPGLVNVRAPLINLLLAREQRAEAEGLIRDLELRLNPVRMSIKDFTRRRRLCKERGLPAMLINTVPKSASESIWNHLAESLNMGQAHLSLGLFPDCCVVPIRVKAACEGGMIAKEHIPATPFNLEILAKEGLNRIICHLRDPRQATLSWSHFVRDDVSMRLLGPLWRKIVPPAAIPKDDLSALIDWCVDAYLPHLVRFVQGWIEADANPNQPIQVLFMSFEDYLADPEDYIDRSLKLYDIKPETFKRAAEGEVVHLRKGLTDEWREIFTPAQRERAWAAIPDDLAKRFAWTE